MSINLPTPTSSSTVVDSNEPILNSNHNYFVTGPVGKESGQRFVSNRSATLIPHPAIESECCLNGYSCTYVCESNTVTLSLNRSHNNDWYLTSSVTSVKVPLHPELIHKLNFLGERADLTSVMTIVAFGELGHDIPYNFKDKAINTTLDTYKVKKLCLVKLRN